MNPRRTRQSALATIAAYTICGVLALAATATGTRSEQASGTADLQAPLDFKVLAITGNTATLGWTPPATGDSPSGYLMEGGLAPGEVLARLRMPGVATTVTLAAPNGVFYVRVRATVGLTEGPPSNEIRVSINVPSPPTGLLGLADGSTATLVWRNTLAGGAPTAIVLDVTGDRTESFSLPLTDRFSFTGVPPGTYTVALRAINASGSSGPSNAVTLTFPGTCSPPATPTDFTTWRSGSTIFVSWSPPANGAAPEGYVVNVAGPINGSFPTTSLTVSGPAAQGTYTLSVTATNSCGTSAATPAQTIGVPPPSLIDIWGQVLDESGGLIDGATVQVVRGEPLGQTVTQTTCGYCWEDLGGFLLTGLTSGVELTLRASAPGYANQEKTFVPMSPSSAVYFTLSRIE